MKESPSGDGSDNRTNRRTILKTGALGVTSLVAGTGLVSAELNEKQPRGSAVHTAKASGGATISDEQRRQVRRRAVRDFERKNGRSPDAIPASDLQSDDGDVVAYAYALDANGVGRAYTGIAGEDTNEPETQSGRAEALIHDRFGGRVAELSSAVTASEQATTMSGGPVTGTNNMQQIYSHKLENAIDPYGVAGATSYWYQDTLDSTDGDIHSFSSPVGFEPGTSAFGSDWENDWGRVFHQWDETEMGNVDVDYGQWQPYGTQGGSSSRSYSLSVSVGWMTASVTAGLSWSYTQPDVEVIDESSSYHNYNQWQLKVNGGDDVSQNFVGFQPSSAASMDHYDSSMGEKTICINKVKGQFVNDGSEHWLAHTSTFYKEPA
ncbi:hypothetical protein [Haladaptatus sp.]|uniref:hypothetical protein n=1 Tax=Haladaptatus sp. TaxID=1973141 RepID=UPI003C37B82E